MNKPKRPGCIRIFGKDCCWDSKIPCGATCQIIWRIWIFIIGILLIVLTSTEMIMTIVVLHDHWDTKEIFVSDRMIKILMLSDNFFPFWLLLSTGSALIIGIWSIALITQPTKVSPVGILSYRIVGSIVTLSIFFGSVCQFVLYFLEWPTSTYKRDLEIKMFNEMGQGNPPSSISMRWLNTQESFACCGILSPKDWINFINTTRLKRSPKGSIHLPGSCCRNDIFHCSEIFAWHTGCLEAQLDTLKYYTNFNVVMSSMLYLVVDMLTDSVVRYFKKFPVSPSASTTNYKKIPQSDEEGKSDKEDPTKPIKVKSKSVEHLPKASKIPSKHELSPKQQSLQSSKSSSNSIPDLHEPVDNFSRGDNSTDSETDYEPKRYGIGRNQKESKVSVAISSRKSSKVKVPPSAFTEEETYESDFSKGSPTDPFSDMSSEEDEQDNDNGNTSGSEIHNPVGKRLSSLVDITMDGKEYGFCDGMGDREKVKASPSAERKKELDALLLNEPISSLVPKSKQSLGSRVTDIPLISTKGSGSSSLWVGRRKSAMDGLVKTVRKSSNQLPEWNTWQSLPSQSLND